MKKNLWLALFGTVVVVHLIGIFLGSKTLQFISKPLIIITLAVYFFIATKGFDNKLQKWVLLALCFSLLGDVLLLFPGERLFFLTGVFSFLVAHVFYIVFFNRVRVREGIPINMIFLALLVFCYASLISFLYPYLGEMKLPISVYSIAMSLVFMFALHMLALKDARTVALMISGPLLFIISDFVLAVNKFYMPIEWGTFIVMATYTTAQLFIVEGARRYITSAVKQ